LNTLYARSGVVGGRHGDRHERRESGTLDG
jgi:hypothetical protein